MCRHREREEQQPGYTVEQLETMRAELQARIIERETHLQYERETELQRQRAERLQAEIEMGETKLANMRAELAIVEAKRSQSAR